MIIDNMNDVVFYGAMLATGLLALFIVWRHY